MSNSFNQREYVKMKSALTRAINSKDPDKIIAACARADTEFKRSGYPDDWSRWERAKDDAEFSKRRQGGVFK